MVGFSPFAGRLFWGCGRRWSGAAAATSDELAQDGRGGASALAGGQGANGVLCGLAVRGRSFSFGGVCGKGEATGYDGDLEGLICCMCVVRSGYF